MDTIGDIEKRSAERRDRRDSDSIFKISKQLEIYNLNFASKELHDMGKLSDEDYYDILAGAISTIMNS